MRNVCNDIAQIEDPSRACQTIKRITERESRLHA